MDEAGGRPKSRQVVVEHLFIRNKNVSLLTLIPLRSPQPACRQPARRLFVRAKAGDGTRTRDSLLGRQVRAESPLASYESALLAG
jgi:hypothetical protein